jgi:nitrite reductase/ring-hydroxylating ferredoxin subunit
MSEESKPTGPDFSRWVPLANIPEGEPVLVARNGGEVFAIGAECTHYHGPLAEGLRVGA